ncbi:MAG: TatD family hydrolase [Tissierellia bacterium]|nr:TatD family hydrolase [Tissierellia bacterium]
MKIIDAHTHITDKAFDKDRDFIIKDLENFNIKAIINPSEDIETSIKAVELSKDYENVYAAVGIHPENVDNVKEEDFIKLEELAKNEKVVAIGEIGLDYYWKDDNKELQKKVFIRQIELAIKLNLPLVIHSRSAAGDTIEILEKYKDKVVCQMHAFGDSVEMMERYVKLGFYISIGGVVTFKNSRKIKEVAKSVPLDRLLIETDAPYLTPEPYRSLRNDPRKIIEVAREISNIKDIKLDKLTKNTTRNTERLFNI